MTDQRSPARRSGQKFGAEQELAQLLPLAGQRPEVPEMRKARVKNAVRLAWRQQTKRRSRRRSYYRFVAAAAAVAAVLTIWIAVPWRPGADESASWAQIARWSEDATLSPATAASTRVAFGSSVTTGSDGFVTLELATGHEIRVDVESRVRLISASVIAVERGAIYVDSRKGVSLSDRKVSVETPYGVVYEVGTRYEVRVDARQLQVRVREGRVDLSANGETYEARKGVQLILDRDGSVTSHDVPTHGPNWDWVVRSATSPQIDHHPLGEFLAWVERETGWTVEYSNPGLAERAPEIVMSGSIEDLGPIEALDVVIPVCGLEYQIEGSRLLLSEQ